MDWLEGVDPHWIWLTLGVVLAGTEMVVSGVYLIWLAMAAIATGILVWIFGPNLPLNVIEFASLSLIAVFSARRFLRDTPIEGADPLMNKRMARMVGEVAVVTEPIAAGSGRVHLGDSEWLARGPDADTGTRVRIVGSNGATLVVEPLDRIGDASGAVIEG